MASAVMELAQQRSDSSLASKSTRPNAPMDVVPLNTSTEKDDEVTVKCNHFSIRGYVSEVRKKDPKTCYPFPLMDSVEPVELPPMEVPQYRWWQCVGCVPEAGGYRGENSKETQKAEDIADTPLPLQVVGQSSHANVSRVRNGEASTSIDSNDNRNYSPPKISADVKGKGKAYAEDEVEPSTAFENGFVKDSSKEQLLQQSTGKVEVSLTAATGAIVLGSQSNGNGAINLLQKDSRVEGVEAESAEENVNCNGELPYEKCREKPQLESLTTNIAPDNILGVVNGPSNSCKSRVVDLPDLNECSGEPPCEENTEAKVVSNNDAFCDDDDDYLGAERRKNPKVRLLSELLGIKETKVSAKGRKKNPSLTNSLDESVKRKRASSQEEGSRSVEIRNSNNGTKMVSETAEISESDSDYETDSDDVSIEIISKSLAKRRCKSRIPLNEKRTKKGKIDHGASSSMQKVLSRSVGHEKGKTSEILPRKSVVTDKLIDRSSVLTKKRNKVFQPGKETASVIPSKSRMPKESAAKQKDEDAEQAPAQKVQKASEAQHYPKTFAIKRNCQVRAAPMADGICLPSPQENRCLLMTTAVGTPTGISVSGNGERSTAAKSLLKERKARNPEAEECSPLAQSMPPKVPKPVGIQKELASEVQRRIRDIDINSIPTDDKVTEQGPVDDIPMDIVELMAKNQYERHMSDRDEQHNNPAPTNIPGKHIRENGIPNSYGECCPKFRQQPHFLSMQKTPSTDARNYMANGNTSHVSDYNRNSLNIPNCLPRENSVSARFLSSTHQGQEHNSPYPPCGLALNNWNGTINVATPQRYPPSNFLQAVESYRYRGPPPRQNTTEGHVTWPSMMANRVPLGIANPQMISQSSNGVNKGKAHRQTSGSILNFNAASGTTISGNSRILTSQMLTVQEDSQRALQGQLICTKGGCGPTSSRQPFAETNSRTSTMQEHLHHPCYPAAIPSDRPNFGARFQSDRGNVGSSSNTGFVGPIPLTLRGQRNIESSHFAHTGVDHQPQRRPMASSLDKGKGISVIPPPSNVSPFHGVKDDTPNLGKGVRHDEKATSSNPEKLICQLNQNPSEFNDLRVVSRYMIGPEDLMPKGTAHDKSARPRGESKRQDMRLNKPIPSGKEREKQRKC
ncbi:Protein EMBRYONIC FLOWER 1 [Bienertia sinuspersici]